MSVEEKRVDEGEMARNQIYSHSAGAMLPVNADMCHLRRNNPPFPRLSATEADSREATLPPDPPAHALIGAAHAHNKRVHAKERKRARLSDPSYKIRHPLTFFQDPWRARGIHPRAGERVAERILHDSRITARPPSTSSPRAAIS